MYGIGHQLDRYTEYVKDLSHVYRIGRENDQGVRNRSLNGAW